MATITSAAAPTRAIVDAASNERTIHIFSGKLSYCLLKSAALTASVQDSVRHLLSVSKEHIVEHNNGGCKPGEGRRRRVKYKPLGYSLVHQIAAVQEPIVLTLASFAVTKLAYVRITKIFREFYMQTTGIDVRFRLTFAASGVQARAVIDGLPADIVALALALDIQKIAEAGLIDLNWKKRLPNSATVCETTVAFVVRKDNPKNIRDWDDLIRSDVGIVVANPKTAGVARWIFLGLWGHRARRGDVPATEYVTSVFNRVVVQPRDAREGSDVFYKQKVGDVLLTYENEVILTNSMYEDKELPYLLPKRDVRIECPVAVVDSVVDNKGLLYRKVADEFCAFLFGERAQREFGKVGFRLNPKVNKAAAKAQVGVPPTDLWSVDKELGGWEKCQAKFFEPGTILDKILEVTSRQKLEDMQAAAKKK